MNRDELSTLELRALERARDLLGEWEEYPIGKGSIPAARAYAALALAAGQRLGRLRADDR